MPIALQNAAFVGYRAKAVVIMRELKHSFSEKSKHRLLVRDALPGHHEAMLKHASDVERAEMAKRLREALSLASSHAVIANACGVTEQAVTGWLKTGRIHKKHLPVIARMTRVSLAWLLDGTPPKHATHRESAQTAPPQPHPDLSDLLESLAALLERADPALREEISRLILRYLDHPDARTRLLGAIEQLLGH